MRANLRIRHLATIAIIALGTAGRAWAGGYDQTNLVSNVSGVAEQTDPNLLNAWGLAYNARLQGPFWVANQYSSTSTVYAFNGTTSSKTLLTVGVNNLGGNMPPSSTPGAGYGSTGIISTGAAGVTIGSSDFLVGGSAGQTALFAFANLDGSISAWHSGTMATIQTSVIGASFTGLGIGDVGSTPYLYAADQNSANVDIFNGKWQMTGHFTDPNLPSGYTAFNVQNINGTLFVTFVNPNVATGGIVDEFKTDGTFIKTLVSDVNGTHLDTPWGMAIAPTGWGQFGGDLLVGNNAVNGWINAYSLDGTYQGHIMLSNGTAFSVPELWGLSFGGGGTKSGSPDVLYFASGGPNQTTGLVGALSVPEPSSAVLGVIGLGLGVAASRRGRARRAKAA
ncbi:MAG: TIGR03118 family protein [Isosphaeraceae bacterium]